MKKILCTITSLCIALISYSQCYPDRHNTSLEESWVSCELTANPNPNKPASHWIMYDLGETYELGQSHFWNLNVNDRTADGISRALAEYSTDGTNWIEWGIFELNEAPSSGFYEGESGPDFSGIAAQYLLITVLETHGGTCAGFSEMKIETTGLSVANEQLAEILNDMKAVPNPALDFTNIEIESTIATQATLQLLDMNGKIVKQNQIILNTGKNIQRLEVNPYAAGQYIVNLIIGDKSKFINLSVVKQ